ncbi:MAG TPA: hypothetical protein VN777_18995 [Terriglobales bacterium]|nr:hypothetical protein [Terriglobales bacterium]
MVPLKVKPSIRAGARCLGAGYVLAVAALMLHHPPAGWVPAGWDQRAKQVHKAVAQSKTTLRRLFR